MKKVLLIKYGEIALRGKNRGLFEGKLIQTIRNNLKDIEGNFYVVKEQGRLILEDLDGDLNIDLVIEKVKTILGIVAVCPCIKTKVQTIEHLQQLAVDHILETFDNLSFSFKVNTRRSDKRYPLESNEVSSLIGGFILENIPSLKVDVKRPDVTVTVELRNEAYIFSKVIKTFGGLPVGSSGQSTLLLSGGIDSPVAGFLMAKRGVSINAVYFHSPPYTSEHAKEKVVDLAKRLSAFTGTINLYVVPFTETQLFIYDSVPPEKTTILMKRVMLRIAEKIGDKNKSIGLIVGDSIGQVASQTLESINAISSATSQPIFRPLSGLDKDEIIDIARKIGTYDISIQPYEDCCTIFVPKHPETKPKKNIIESFEEKMFLSGLEELMETAIINVEIITV